MLTATIIVVAILTILVFMLVFVACSSFIKAEKLEIENGHRDDEMRQDIEKEKKKSSKILNIFGSVIGGAIAVGLLAVASLAIIYRASGEQFSINNHVSLVIVSDSMDGFYNDDYRIEMLENKETAEKDQFRIGDLLDFTKVAEDQELTLFDVYGYKTSQGRIITHRYIGNAEDGKLIFRGDNTGGRDSYVTREQIVLHYEDLRIPRVGLFILFSQSGFGLYAFISAIVIYVVVEIYAAKYDKMIKERLKAIDDNVIEQTPEPEIENPVENVCDPTEIIKTDEENKGKRVQFKTRSGRIVSFYRKAEKPNEEKTD